MKFPVQTPVAPSLPKLSVFQPGDEEESVERTEIQGQSVGSREEARVATALDKLGHRYFYQFRILDMKGVRGAYIIDFLVLSTVPLSTPVEVYGAYWHRGQLGSEDQFRLAQIEDHFRGEANDVVIIWGNEVQTQDDANAVVQRKIGPA